MREVLKPLYMKEGRAQQNGVCYSLNVVFIIDCWCLLSVFFMFFSHSCQPTFEARQELCRYVCLIRELNN